MHNTVSNIPLPVNEPVLSYAPGSKERELLIKEIAEQESKQIEIPLIIGGKEVKTGNTETCVQPHDHKKVLCTYHVAGEKEVQMAIDASQKAKKQWENLPYVERARIFLKAADLLSTKYRNKVNAATMLNQSKNVFQAEIDSVCELIDFWKFNAYYMQQLYTDQPLYSPAGMMNSVEYRALEGFVFAVSPFNFTSIGGNLPTAPAMMGNTALWKPASTAVYSNYLVMQILIEAGLPDGVINFIPGPGAAVGNQVINSPLFAGIHFTGSTAVFQGMWKQIGANIENYKSYPRIVGETGGKDFMVVHSSAAVQETAVAMVRGAFEYQGQKCSALSRAYVPESLWPAIKESVGKMLAEIKMGPVQDFANFVNAVIDQKSFDKTKSYLDRAAKSSDAEIIFGGNCDDSVGYFIEPTVILASKPDYETMVDELFAPVLSVYIYPDNEFEEIMHTCDTTSIYALTGCIMAKDRYAVQSALENLRHSAGNFYINDKPTGAVVGQQPFGGGRGSGTNDKAGSMQNLLRWVSVRTIKENFITPVDYKYPFMG